MKITYDISRNNFEVYIKSDKQELLKMWGFLKIDSDYYDAIHEWIKENELLPLLTSSKVLLTFDIPEIINL